jgi:phage tail sheath protein FI
MPPALTYPGVYIQELSDGIPAIEGVPTSITAFIGRAERGPSDKPVLIHDFLPPAGTAGNQSTCHACIGYATMNTHSHFTSGVATGGWSAGDA